MLYDIKTMDWFILFWNKIISSGEITEPRNSVKDLKEDHETKQQNNEMHSS